MNAKRFFSAVLCAAATIASAAAEVESSDAASARVHGYAEQETAALLAGEDSRIGAVLKVRIKGEWSPSDRFSFRLEAEGKCSTGPSNQTAAASSAGFLPPLPAEFPPEDRSWSFLVDQAYFSANFDRFDVTFGKVPIAWGTGYVFNPTSKSAPAGMAGAVDEETPGVLAVVPSFAFGDSVSAQAYVAFEQRARAGRIPSADDGAVENLPWGARISFVAGAFDLSVSVLRQVGRTATGGYASSFYAGADFCGSVGPFGVYGEAAVRLPDEHFDYGESGADDALDACAGFDYGVPGTGVTLRAEYYYQGSGSAEEKEYDFASAMAGDRSAVARDYVFVRAERTFGDVLETNIGALVNLDDLSFAGVPRVQWTIRDDFRLHLAAVLPFGDAGTEFDGVRAAAPGGPAHDFLVPTLTFGARLSF